MKSDSLFNGNFETVYLDDYKTTDENRIIESQPLEPDQVLEDLTWGDLRYGKLALPFLLRYVQGDPSQISLHNPEVVHQLKGGLRLALRYEKLIRKLRPTCTVLFNGLFLPENYFGDINERNDIATLYTERNPRINSLFISDQRGPLYRLDSLWHIQREKISDKEIATAEGYVKSRDKLNEDALGGYRDLNGIEETKFDQMTSEPYTILFAPIFFDTASMKGARAFRGIFDFIDRLCAEASRSRCRLIIRCHPDEARAGSIGCYTVKQYLSDKDHLRSDRIVCLEASEAWNPYRLAEKARAIIVYNGSLGMELPALGMRIFNIANSHYAEKGFTAEINSAEELRKVFFDNNNRLSSAEKRIALKYLWFYHFQAGLDLSELIQEVKPGKFAFGQLENNPIAAQAMKAVDDRVNFLLDGVLHSESAEQSA